MGELFVSVGNDANVTQLKAKPMFPEAERVYMVASIRWVTHAFVARGMGHDQAADLEFVKPDIYFVNEDGDKEIKRQQCAERGNEIGQCGTSVRRWCRRYRPHRADRLLAAATRPDLPFRASSPLVGT